MLVGYAELPSHPYQKLSLKMKVVVYDVDLSITVNSHYNVLFTNTLSKLLILLYNDLILVHHIL